MAKHNGITRLQIRRFGRRLLLGILACAGVMYILTGAGAIVFMETIPFSIPSSVFAVGGGEVIPTHVERTLVSSIGTTSISRMEGGSYVLGTGIVGAISPSQANLDNAHAFPVPFIPSQGHTQIIFSNITTQATVFVYTLSGELITELIKSDPTSDRVAWSPVVNRKGQPVASGVYHWVIEADDGETKIGKLMIIK